jgi:hypothetical protein
MGMTITEKILARTGGLSKVLPGDVVVVDVETDCLLDLSFLPEGWRKVLKVANPSKVVIIFDHLVPAPTVQAAECMKTGRAFAKEFGKRLHDVGADQGISHAVIADKAYALPGTVLVNADSHTCSAGAFNCAARGVGGPDMLYAVTTGKAWFRVGETTRYDFTGKLRPGVSAKDIFLIAGKWGAHVNQNIEYGGPGIHSMSLNARRTLTTMGTELSAEFVTFEPDDALTEYVRARERSRSSRRCRMKMRSTKCVARSTSTRLSHWCLCPMRWSTTRSASARWPERGSIRRSSGRAATARYRGHHTRPDRLGHLTEAALQRNIEVGILPSASTPIATVRAHFEALIHNGVLRQMPLCANAPDPPRPGAREGLLPAFLCLNGA